MAKKRDTLWSYEPVPKDAVRLYRMAWQLETWLRLMVYVELRAARADWEEPIKQQIRGWPPTSQENDKRLYHMATPHQAAISYLSFGELWKIVNDVNNWPLFAPYFPPKVHVDPRIEEIKSIRNRVAHFRESHPLDESRFEMFMKDMEPGVRRFCKRYAGAKYVLEDPVVKLLEENWERIGYGIEMSHCCNGWLYAPEPLRIHPKLNATLEFLTHSGYKAGSDSGSIYKLVVHSRNDRGLDSVGFFEATKNLHSDIIHILLSQNADEISVTIPAIHGPEHTVGLVEAFLHAALNSARSVTGRRIEDYRSEWPEYVLWPNHLLTFFDDDCRQPILDLAKRSSRSVK